MLLDRRRDPESSAWQWEQELIDSYLEHRWALILTPLCEQLDRWKAGEHNYHDVVQAVRTARKADDTLQALVAKDRDWLVKSVR
ncbi:MAG: hypothetical protein M1541_11425, partial [Acidobacteria bacterium]|nr:hypothetical protein [Acidobacteriota bacterium]